MTISKTEMKKRNCIRARGKRIKYMEKKITHKTYFLWCAQFLGVTNAMLPVSNDELLASIDWLHFNDIPLYKWDQKDHLIKTLANAKGIPWSKADSVCLLKTLARQVVMP